jgi:hypothetical protein
VLLVHGPVMQAGSFPWGLLIIAGLIYLVWNKGAGRPWGRGFDNHQMHSGPQALFDQWHREAHQAAAPPQGGQPFATQSQGEQPFATQPQAPFAAPPQAPFTAQPQAPFAPAASAADVPGTPPASQAPQPPTAGSSGPVFERW